MTFKLPPVLPSSPEGWRNLSREQLHSLAVQHDGLIAGMLACVEGKASYDDARTLLMKAVEYQSASVALMQLAYALGQAVLNEDAKRG
jgi:hypothetical protein